MAVAVAKPNRDFQGKSSSRRYRGKMQHLLRSGLDRLAAMRRARAYAGGKTSPRAGDLYLYEDGTIQGLIELGEIGQPIQIAKCGTFAQSNYGPFAIEPGHISNMAANFKRNVRGIKLAVDENHEPDHKAVGWFKDVEVKDKALWATVEWNDIGTNLIKQDRYRYFSPEFKFEYVDDETGIKHGPTLLGGALTNRPFLKGMEPVQLSERLALDDPTQGEVHVDTIMQPPKRKKRKAKPMTGTTVLAEGSGELGMGSQMAAWSTAGPTIRAYRSQSLAEGDAADQAEDDDEGDRHEAMLTWVRQALIDAASGYDTGPATMAVLSALNTYLDADDAEDDAESGETEGAAALLMGEPAKPVTVGVGAGAYTTIAGQRYPVTPGNAGVGGHVTTTVNGVVTPLYYDGTRLALDPAGLHPYPPAGQPTAPSVVQANEPTVPTEPAAPARSNDVTNTTPTLTPTAPDATVALAEVARLQQELALKEQAISAKEASLAEKERDLRTRELTERVETLCKPDANGIVRIVPAQKDNALKFVLALNDQQADAYLDMQTQNVGIKLGEVGQGVSVEQGGTQASAVDRLNARVNAYLAENKGLTYTQALEAVTLAEPQLGHDYHAEQAARHR